MDVSILIPLFNRLDLTRACVDSLERTARRVRWEVIFVDDGSTDGTRDFLRTLPAARYRTILNDAPRGYAANNNAAARLARAPALCLLNNDTVLLAGWLEPMLQGLARLPKIGCVGNVQREPVSGLIDHLGITFNAEGIPIHAGKNEAAPPPETFDRWAAVTAACCAVRRDVFLGLGGFDEGFRNGFEDVDFCLRAAETGLAHHTANRSVIYHYVSASPGRHAHEADNLRRYRERWGSRIAAYQARREAALAEWRARPRESEFTPEDEFVWQARWDAVREARRQHGQDIVDARRDGRRYLHKHLLHPWRYNLKRLCRAVMQATRPRLAPLLPWPPRIQFDSPAAAGPPPVSDQTLFDPPHL